MKKLDILFQCTAIVLDSEYKDKFRILNCSLVIVPLLLKVHVQSCEKPNSIILYKYSRSRKITKVPSTVVCLEVITHYLG